MAKSKKPRKGIAHGKLKAAILKELKAAGKNGITVKELAARCGVKYGNISRWFYSTGKRIKAIKRIGEAKYTLG